MDTPLQSGRAVRYACAVLADCRIGALPVDPFDLASRAGIMLLPLFRGTGYDENQRTHGDFGSNLYIIEEET